MDKGAECYKRYKNGDDRGFYDLVREYYDGLTAFINGIIGDFGQAEEIADDVLFKIAVKKPPFHGKASFKTWLYTIGRNAAADAMRKKRAPVTESMDDVAEIASSVEEAYIKSEEKRRLYEALDRLTPDMRQVIWLSYFDGMSMDEIAVCMKRSRSSIYTLSSRAKAELKDILAEEV